MEIKNSGIIKAKELRVYIMGPYTKGDVAQNVSMAITVAERLSTEGFIPYIPHLTHFWHMMYYHNIEFWYEYDIHWLNVCQAGYRMLGESRGADEEEEVCKAMQIPVFKHIPDIVEWGLVYKETIQ